ncbi:hypothetical protein JOB18_041949 [Solea senegalensis]|uniref:Uncharacterized protein n=1 Tax=Solea senegalensis TaxID=28829 RepID=A0AAV6RQ24_SOLSE|nr:hypothetical protein JOB18_041949 [Solea senegalensis]
MKGRIVPGRVCEVETHDITARGVGGGRGKTEIKTETSSLTDDEEDELEETAATVKIDPVNKPGESEQHGDMTDRESEIKS